MNFDSAFFMFFFFPVLAVFYLFLPKAGIRRVILFLCGILFYAFGSLSGVFILLCSCLANYLFREVIIRTKSKGLMALGVTANLGFLFTYKYLSFLISDILGFTMGSFSLAAPLGISFYTFKAISSLVDGYKKPEENGGNLFDYGLYLSFFPQILAGPITRYSDMVPQLRAPAVSAQVCAYGMGKFIIGLGEKLIISAPLGAVVDKVFASPALDASLGWLGAVGYTLQLYFDFAGYSHMAIGLGEIFGIKCGKNFDFPYIADSITSFWRRWHISLSTWFKDYLYIPLGGNRKGKYRTALNKAIVFTLCGLWHGAAFTYVLWGLWHGLLSALESLRIIDTKKLGKSFFGKALCHIYTLLAVCLGFVMFRAESVEQGFRVISAMFSFGSAGVYTEVLFHSLFTVRTVFLLIFAAIFSTDYPKKLWNAIPSRPVREICGGAALLTVLAVSVTSLAAGGFAPFIYLQF